MYGLFFGIHHVLLPGKNDSNIYSRLGSSNTAIVITEHLKDPEVIRVIYAEEFNKANPSDIVYYYNGDNNRH
jgi:hypothetical protein